MLTLLEIESFKAISDRVTMPLAPITLLFGPNSVGKSTALQALHYIHHLLRRGNPSADRVPHGGSAVDLGGFGGLVHMHDLDRVVRIRVGFGAARSINVFDQNIDTFAFGDLDDQVRRAWVELAVASEVSRDGMDAAISEMSAGVDTESLPLVRTTRELEPDGEALYAWVNISHPFLAECASSTDAFELFDCAGAKVEDPNGTVWWKGRVKTRRLSALPQLERPIVLLETTEGDDVARSCISQLQTLLTMLLVGIPSLLLEDLEAITYVGPMRVIPSRGFVPERSPRAGRWADGAGAWDALAFGGFQLRGRVNGQLEKLGVPYKVAHQHSNGLVVWDDTNTDDGFGSGRGLAAHSLVLVDTKGTALLPTDVGVGVSQIIPVVAACTRPGKGLVVIEQPELHIHPGWQVGLGDLFIEGAQTRQMLVETHSEHLVLRLLRRIRETAEGELADGAPPFSTEKLSVLYVEATPEGVRVRRLRVDEHGEFKDQWPRGFFAERMEELL